MEEAEKEMQHQLVQAEIFSTFSTFLVHQYHTTKSGSILTLERWRNIKGPQGIKGGFYLYF